MSAQIKNDQSYYIENSFCTFEDYENGKIIQNVDDFFSKDKPDYKFRAECDYEKVDGGVKLTLTKYSNSLSDRTYTIADSGWDRIIGKWKNDIYNLKLSLVHNATHGLGSMIYNTALEVYDTNDDIFKLIQLFNYSDEGFLTRAGIAFIDLPSWVPIKLIPNMFDKKQYFYNFEFKRIIKSQLFKKVLFPSRENLPESFISNEIHCQYNDVIGNV